MKKKLIILSMGMLPLMAAHAQQDTTLVRTVVVENQYNPTVMDASKINVLPKVEEPTVPKTHIDYANSIRPVSAWKYQAMQPMVKDWAADAAYRGYFLAGYGFTGNDVDVRLGYLWDITENDRLNMSASLDGWYDELRGAEDGSEDWTSRLYQTQVGLDYKHSFKKMDWSLGGNFRSQVFSYMPYASPAFQESQEGTGKQHQTLANAYMGFASTDKDMPVQFAAEAGMNYFKMKYATLYQDDGSEMNLYVKGDVWKKISDENRFGLKVKFDNYAYSANDMEGATGIDLKPYYALENDDWRIRLGVNIDWWGGRYGLDEEDENKLYFSPDVSVEHVFSDTYVVYGKAGGGRNTRSFYQLTTEFSPYWMHADYVPTYVTLDAALGVKGSPVNGLWFNVSGGYKITENDFVPGLIVDNTSYFTSPNECKTKVFYGTAELKYDYKDLWDFSLEGTYYSWDAKGMYLSAMPDAGAFDPCGLMPQFEIDAEVGFRPISALRVELGYEYVKRCEGNVYQPINNLYVGADYALMKNLSVYAQATNLLNKEYVRFDGYPAQKLNFLVGLSLQF